MSRFLSLGLLLALVGCPAASTDGTNKPGIFDDQDADDDGFDYDVDCDDENPSVNPDAPELCDGADVDEDCDGLSDNADPSVTGGVTVFHDADNDGYGEDGSGTAACEASAGYTPIDGDCDDGDPLINPGAVEICDPDDVDEDCNEVADDDDPDVLSTDMHSYWVDNDGDGFGYGTEELYCDAPEGYVRDESSDCDDNVATTYPDAEEVCNGRDDDCDGLTDESSATDVTTWYADEDADGYGNVASTRATCERPAGFVADATDCDDRSPDIHPDAAEECDEEDDDCDGDIDEADGTTGTTWYRDVDGDGYGDDNVTTAACDRPSTYVAIPGDCDDSSASINPSEEEVCDSTGIDEDCDGLVDDDDWSTSTSGMTTYAADDDGDGYGDPYDSEALCDFVSGYVTNTDDCDDTDAAINPAGTEVCDAADDDEDCDGNSDDDDSSATSKSTFYRDADLDTYGVSTTTTSRCDSTSGWVSNTTDCDDTDANVNPGETEICDSANEDEDCDGYADDNDTSTSSTGKTTYYRDSDGDAYGLSTSYLSRCDRPSGYVSVTGDCDDADANANPGEVEVCLDGVDNDCDGYDTCEATAASADREFIGDDAGDATGWVADAGDVNDDGTNDIIFGAYNSDRGATASGAAFVVYGGGSGDLDLGSANTIYLGEDASDYAGTSVAGVGDYDGNGFADVAIGAPGDDDGGSLAGQVYYFRGRSTGSIDLSTAYAKFMGENSGDGAGTCVAEAGDVSGDGRPDTLIGAYGRSSSAGGAYLITTVSAGVTDLSAATAILTGETASDYAGRSVDGNVDLNGDGYDDILVGAEGDDDAATNAGAAYVILGPQSGTASLSTADAKRRGYTTSDAAGTLVVGAGDVNDDGYGDILVGAPGYGTYGAVYLELGPITGTASVTTMDARIDGTSGIIGSYVAADGDFDGDGYSDIVIGNPTDDTAATDAGSAYLFLGPVSASTTTASADLAITGSTASDGFGSVMDFVGSQAGTANLWDLAITAPGGDDGGTAAGQVYLFSYANL